MGEIDVTGIRDAYEAYQALMRDPHWESHRIFEWGGHELAVVGQIGLTPGLQRLLVIDVTRIEADWEYNGEQRAGFPVARFALAWPACNSGRRHVLVYHADEGHDGILLEDGSTMWVHYADLPIRVVPGSTEDYQVVKQAQMDELEQAVDAGAPLEF